MISWTCVYTCEMIPMIWCRRPRSFLFEKKYIWQSSWRIKC